MKYRYGLLGCISLIGLLGLVEENPAFYPFLAFLLFFQYLFVTPDEMFIANMRKAAAWAFYADLAAVTAVTVWNGLRSENLHQGLAAGMGMGFGLALIVFSFATTWFDWRERRGLTND